MLFIASSDPRCTLFGLIRLSDIHDHDEQDEYSDLYLIPHRLPIHARCTLINKVTGVALAIILFILTCAANLKSATVSELQLLVYCGFQIPLLMCVDSRFQSNNCGLINKQYNTFFLQK